MTTPENDHAMASAERADIVDIEDLATRFVSALERNDVEMVRAIYAPNAAIWHNFDLLEQSVEDNIRSLQWMLRKLTNMAYTEIRRIIVSDGFIQQHVLRGTAPGGEDVAIHAMLRVTVTDGRITRLEEYLDPAQAAALSRRG